MSFSFSIVGELVSVRHLEVGLKKIVRSGWPKRENLESCGGKSAPARLGPFNLNWPEQVFYGRRKRTNGKRLGHITTRQSSQARIRELKGKGEAGR